MILSHRRLSAHLTNLLVKMEPVFLTTGDVMVKQIVWITLMRQNLLAVVSAKAGLVLITLDTSHMISPKCCIRYSTQEKGQNKYPEEKCLESKRKTSM